MAIAIGDPVPAAWANQRPAADAGVVSITVSSANGTGSASISFADGRFSSTPAVVGIAYTSSPDQEDVSVAGASASGATLYLTRPAAGTINVGWIAMDTLT